MLFLLAAITNIAIIINLCHFFRRNSVFIAQTYEVASYLQSVPRLFGLLTPWVVDDSILIFR
jgi:hypothetical protein